MKKQPVLRDQIYIQMDRLVNHANAIKKSLPTITLNSAQFQIFKDFNKSVNGIYHYRGIEVKSL